MNQQKGFANIALIVLVVALAGAVGYFALVNKPPEAAQQADTPTSTSQTSNETTSWISYTYSSVESEILPNITFKYPSLFGSNPALISSRNTNRPGNISDDWGGFVEFNPTGGELRIEFFKRTNSEISFESYVTKSATARGWASPKYFQADGYKVARLRFDSSSHYDADVGWYFVELPDKVILEISTSGDKKYLYNDDLSGNSTRDKIISTLKIAQ